MEKAPGASEYLIVVLERGEDGLNGIKG